jgi:hypothetical protein
MGRTLPSVSIIMITLEHSLGRYRRALRRADQLALDELFNHAHKHVAEAAYAADPFPMDIFLLSMILEEYKEVMRLRQKIDELLSGRDDLSTPDNEPVT